VARKGFKYDTGDDGIWGNQKRLGAVLTGPAATEKTDVERDQAATQLVEHLSTWSGAAGFIPVPLVDIAAVAGVHLYMLRRLSEIYGIPFSENRANRFLPAWRER
jgi:hypothetical protein